MTSTHLLRRLLLCVSVALVLGGPGADTPHAQSSVLVATTATWTYLDDGSNQGTAWRTPAFNDSTWASGPAQLGYGDGDETTVVSFGPNSSATLTRAPYLQLGTPASTVVRWRTSAPASSRVQFGPTPDALGSSVSDATLRTDHEMTLTGLTPDTPYCYAVGTTTTTLAGGDPSHCFTTAPVVGTPKGTRIWVLGDSGTADANARAVRDAFYAWMGTQTPDLWLMLATTPTKQEPIRSFRPRCSICTRKSLEAPSCGRRWATTTA